MKMVFTNNLDFVPHSYPFNTHTFQIEILTGLLDYYVFLVSKKCSVWNSFLRGFYVEPLRVSPDRQTTEEALNILNYLTSFIARNNKFFLQGL